MKKVLIGMLFVASPLVAQANNYGASGCGVGSMIFDGQTGLGPHVLAGTTNNIFGNQTFGMSTGSLGCDVTGTINSQAALYIDSDMENIASAIAIGEGEALMTLAVLLKVEAEDRDHFYTTLKENFDTLYPNSTVSSNEMIESLAAIMQNDAVLSKYSV